MYTFSDFIKGNGESVYVHEKEYCFYRCDSGDKYIISHNYLVDYSDVSIQNAQANAQVIGFYEKEVDTFVLMEDFHFFPIREMLTMKCLHKFDVRTQISKEMEALLLNTPTVKKALSDEVIDKLYESSDKQHFYKAYLQGKELLYPEKSNGWWKIWKSTINGISNYLKQPEKFVSALAKVVTEKACMANFVPEHQQEVMYQRYKQYHDQHQTYKKEQELIKLFNEQFSDGYKIRAILNNGKGKWVYRQFEIKENDVLISCINWWEDSISIKDIKAVRFRRKVFELPVQEMEVV